jgi:hypothetical protein
MGGPTLGGWDYVSKAIPKFTMNSYQKTIKIWVVYFCFTNDSNQGEITTIDF